MLKMDSLSLQIEKSFENISDIQEEWDELVNKAGGSVYLSYDWCRVWWEYYGNGSTLRIFLFRNGDSLVGIVPICIERVWLGPIWLKIARIIGSNLPPKISDPPIDKTSIDSVYELLLAKLFGEDGCDVVSFGPLSGTNGHAEVLREVTFKQKNDISIVRDSTKMVHTMFYLPESYEEYLKSLSKSERTLCNRKMKKLENSYDIKIDVVSDSEHISEEFKKFEHMHGLQWQSEGKPGHFGAWPKAGEFNFALVKAQAERGRMRMIRLTTDGRVLLYQYVFALGDSYYWRLPSREIGPEVDQLSLGLVGMLVMIKTAIKEGIKCIEGGIGHYEYKIKLGATEYTARHILLAANKIGVYVRCHIFCFLADILDIFYNKIWISRVLPRIGRREKPFWNIWIRSRI